MALETMDVTRDDLISRGLGTSALGSQRIQRMNIEELRSLRSNVSQSIATLDNEKNSRLKEVQKLVAKQGAEAFRSFSGGGSQNGLPEVLIQDTSPNGQNADSGYGPQRFQVYYGGVGIQNRESFATIEELISTLKSRGTIGRDASANVVMQMSANLDNKQRSILSDNGIGIIDSAKSERTKESAGSWFPTFTSPGQGGGQNSSSNNPMASQSMDMSPGRIQDAIVERAISQVGRKNGAEADVALLAAHPEFAADLRAKQKRK